MPTLIQRVCFTCRKVFKKPFVDIVGFQNREKFENSPKFKGYNTHKCPQCGEDMIFMGHKFRAPKTDDVAEWKRIAECLRTGVDYGVRTVRKVKPKPKLSPQLRIGLGIYGKRRKKPAA